MNQIIRSVLAEALLLIQLACSGIAASDGTGVKDSIQVDVPAHYTAMEGDLEVSFELLMPNAFSHNAIVGLEYLAGDSILPSGSRHLTRPRKLASQVHWRRSASGLKRSGPCSWNSHWMAFSGTPASASGDT